MKVEQEVIELDLTQPAEDAATPDTEPVPQTPPGFPYARLRPLASFANQTELYLDVTVCGRSVTADIPIGVHDGSPTWNRQISKKHFEIHREWSEDGRCLQGVFLKDTSMNGTFINQKRVAKGQMARLNCGDIIAIGDNSLGVDFNVFLFSDLSAAAVYPPKLTQTYIMTGVLLGKGGYGNVELARSRRDCSLLFAIKELHKERFAANPDRKICKLEEIRNEANLMMRIDHPNVVRCVEWQDTPDTAYIILEYLSGGEFFSRIVDPRWERKGLGDVMGRFYAYQLLMAVSYLHDNKICHRDIKPENILLLEPSDYTVVKLADFGLAKYNTVQGTQMKTFCGTPCYIAPEIVENTKSPYQKQVDIWSLGVVLFTAFTGYPPFSADYDDMPLNEQIKTGRLMLLKHWNNVEVDSQEAILKMLNVEQFRRATAKELLAMPWMQGDEAKRAHAMVAEHAKQRASASTHCVQIDNNNPN